MTEPAEALSPAAEAELRITEAMNLLSSACDKYRALGYFGKSLDEHEEVRTALSAMVTAHSQAVVVMRQWKILAHDSQAFERGDLAELSALGRRGSNILRNLKSAQAYSGHLAGQCARLRASQDVEEELADTADDSFLGIRLISDTFETDVAGIQNLLSVLTSASQATMAQQMRSLTRWTTILTVVLLVVTVFAAVVAGVATL